MDCFADDREALNDFAKYFNNSHLSDVSLLVGDDMFVSYNYLSLDFYGFFVFSVIIQKLLLLLVHQIRNLSN